MKIILTIQNDKRSLSTEGTLDAPHLFSGAADSLLLAMLSALKREAIRYDTVSDVVVVVSK